MPVIVAPSILAADFSRLGDEIHRVEAAGADWIHCDIMDGHFVHKIDVLLIMTVRPGFGGQSFRTDQMHKVKRARSLNRNLDIEVDGGINADTAKLSIENGANVLVAGTSIFHSKDYAKAIRQLRGE